MSMAMVLGNVLENKKFVPTNQDPKILQERWHTRFRPLLTNGCSGRRVGEVGGSRSRDASHDPTHDLSHEQIPRSIPSNRSLKKKKKKKKKMLLEEGSKL